MIVCFFSDFFLCSVTYVSYKKKKDKKQLPSYWSLFESWMMAQKLLLLTAVSGKLWALKLELQLKCSTDKKWGLSFILWVTHLILCSTCWNLSSRVHCFPRLTNRKSLGRYAGNGESSEKRRGKGRDDMSLRQRFKKPSFSCWGEYKNLCLKSDFKYKIWLFFILRYNRLHKTWS